MHLKIGIEHEFVFRDRGDVFLDFNNTTYRTFEQIVDKFPYIEDDDLVFECKSLETRPKRCYVEGFERYSKKGKITQTIAKGLELRTLPYCNIRALMDDYKSSYTKMVDITESFGLSPVLCSAHPLISHDTFMQPLNDTEKTMRTKERLRTVYQSMFLYGLQINVSIEDATEQQMADLVEKINYYAPYIIPFGFSSPFYNGNVFEGLSYRSYSTATSRQFVKLNKRKGVSVIEFGGFDACGDFDLLESLLYLFKGLILDTTLEKRSVLQDPTLMKESAMQGFESERIQNGGFQVLRAAKKSLDDHDVLTRLEKILETNESYATKMKQMFYQTGDIFAGMIYQKL